MANIEKVVYSIGCIREMKKLMVKMTDADPYSDTKTDLLELIESIEEAGHIEIEVFNNNEFENGG